MPVYRVTLRVETSRPSTAEMRFWIDADLGRSLESEIELELSRVSDTQWTATFSTPTSDSFIYRAGVRATEGAIWSLLLERVSPRPCEVLFDSDVLTMCKEWLVGSVEDQREYRHESAHYAS